MNTKTLITVIAQVITTLINTNRNKVGISRLLLCGIFIYASTAQAIVITPGEKLVFDFGFSEVPTVVNSSSTNLSPNLLNFSFLGSRTGYPSSFGPTTYKLFDGNTLLSEHTSSTWSASNYKSLDNPFDTFVFGGENQTIEFSTIQDGTIQGRFEYIPSFNNPGPDDRIDINIFPMLYWQGYEDGGSLFTAPEISNINVSQISNDQLIFDIPRETIQIDAPWSTRDSNGVTTNSFDLIFENQELLIEMDIALTGVDPGAELISIWENGIQDIWSNKFDITDGTYSYPILFDVEFTDDPENADWTVNVGENGRPNTQNWYIDPSWTLVNDDGNLEFNRLPENLFDQIAAHEFAHMLGIYDEYEDGLLDPITGIIDVNSIMGEYLRDPQARHYEMFLENLELLSDIDLALLEAQAPPYPYYDSVPDNFIPDGLPTDRLSVAEPPTITIILVGFIMILYFALYGRCALPICKF